MPRSTWRTSATPLPAPIRQARRASATGPQRYLAELDALDHEVRDAVGKIPPARRKVISTHDAFGYFAAAYGIAFIAPLGVSTESEPSARDIARIIGQVEGGQDPGRLSREQQRRPAGRPHRGGDRRCDRRHAVFRQPHDRKGRRPHLHCHGQAQYKGVDQRAGTLTVPSSGMRAGPPAAGGAP